MDVEATVARVARGQLGLVTTAQALSAGMSASQLQRRVRSGLWERRHPGVFALAGVPRSWEQRALAAVLAGGRGAVLSHRAAARLHGMLGGRPRPECSVPTARNPRVGGVVVHRVVLPDEHVTRLHSVPVTSVARTLADCSSRMPAQRLAAMLDDALVAGLTTVGDIRDVLGRLPAARGRSLRTLRGLLAQRGHEAARAESRPEARLYRVLVAAGLPAPVQQYELTVAGERFRLDLAYPDVRLGLEYMGFDPHRSRSAHDRDFRRDRLLTAAGWTILYFTSATTDADVLASVRPFLHIAS